jgi:hypothetical protein
MAATRKNVNANKQQTRAGQAGDVADLSSHFVATLTGSHCETSQNAHNLRPT